MAEDELDEIPTPAEQPAKPEIAEPEKNPAEQKAEMKSQMMGLVTLLVVFGLLWGLVKVMPSLGEKLNSGISSWSSKGDGESEPEEGAMPNTETEGHASKVDDKVEPAPVAAALKPEIEKAVEPAPVLAAELNPASPAEVVAEASADPIPKDEVKSQILEAIGGAERGQVRHVSFSDDASKMIASLKMTPESGEAKLIEVIFERDDFGRYISSENSPLDTPIKIWK